MRYDSMNGFLSCFHSQKSPTCSAITSLPSTQVYTHKLPYTSYNTQVIQTHTQVTVHKLPKYTSYPNTHTSYRTQVTHTQVTRSPSKQVTQVSRTSPKLQLKKAPQVLGATSHHIILDTSIMCHKPSS